MLKLLIVGGCHVNGFLVGERRGSVAVMRDDLVAHGIPVITSTLAPISVKDVKAVSDLRDKERPDIVILQLGNYETSQLYQKAIRRALHISRRRKAAPVHGCVVGARSEVAVDEPHARWWNDCWMWGKYSVDRLLGSRLVNVGDFGVAFESFCQTLAQGNGPVVVLSPIPCVDVMAMRYRRRLGGVMREVAMDCRSLYVDLLSEEWAGASFINHFHLGAAEHLRLGRRLADVLRREVIVQCQVGDQMGRRCGG